MRSWRRLLAVGLLASAGFAGAAVAADDTIRIGVLNDQSGPYADLGGPGSTDAAKMAVEDFGGQILGRKLEVIAADHQNKPNIATNIAQEWYDSRGVDLIVDIPNSGVAMAVQEVSRQRKKPVILVTAQNAIMTNEKCSPYSIQWTNDTYSMGLILGKAVVETGAKKWFFITVDYAGGHATEADMTKWVIASGGTVVGHVRHPLDTSDFASYLLQAQASGADVIALANAGADTINAIKQAAEFGIIAKGQKIVVPTIYISDVNSLGLQNAQGLLLTSVFYWDHDPESRAWAQRYFKRNGKMPTMVQAGTYSAVAHYLKAVKAANTMDGTAVMAKMREIPVNDFMTKDGKIRPDGSLVRERYLYEVKSPAESKGPWDYYKLLRTIPGPDAARPVAESKCPLVQAN